MVDKKDRGVVLRPVRRESRGRFWKRAATEKVYAFWQEPNIWPRIPKMQTANSNTSSG